MQWNSSFNYFNPNNIPFHTCIENVKEKQKKLLQYFYTFRLHVGERFLKGLERHLLTVYERLYKETIQFPFCFNNYINSGNKRWAQTVAFMNIDFDPTLIFTKMRSPLTPKSHFTDL